MIRTDSHLHCMFSSDSNTPMEEMILTAIELELSAICMTDHYDMDFPVTEEGMDFYLDTDAYLAEFSHLKEQYKDKINLYIGVELGIMPSLGQKLPAYLARYADAFDFVIGSTHIVDGFDPYNPLYYGSFSDERDGMRRYLEVNLSNLETFDGMDTFAHLDYAVRYAPHKDEFYIPSDHFDIIDICLKKLIQKGISLEFNTAGLKYGMKQANPHIDILKRYRELGGELITIGSDGHQPKHMAWDFKTGEEILKTAGFTYYAFYQKREPVMLKLD